MFFKKDLDLFLITSLSFSKRAEINVLHTGTRRSVGALGADPALYARDVGT